MNIVVLISLLLIGLIIIVMGLVLWKKQKISLMHSYHYKNVADEYVPVYTKWQGIALLLTGIATMAMGILIFLDFPLIGVIQLIVLYGLSVIIFVKTQLKYNNGIF